MLLDVSFKNFGCIWSGSGDLVTFNFSRCFSIISGLNSIEKRKLWKKYRYNKNPQNKTKYEEARTEANMLVRKAKYEYERTILIY
jgi:hypothetical protein